jgi:hypothetical protein
MPGCKRVARHKARLEKILIGLSLAVSLSVFESLWATTVITPRHDRGFFIPAKAKFFSWKRRKCGTAAEELCYSPRQANALQIGP